MIDAGLIHCMQTAYPTQRLPITYQDGNKCIDHIFLSTNIADTIRACGALPLRLGYASDHRMIYCDLDLGDYFGGKHHRAKELISRPLQKSRPRVWTAYKDKLQEYYHFHRILPKAK